MRLSALFSSLTAFGLLAVACAPTPDAPAGATSTGASSALSAAALDSVKAVDAAFAAGVNAGDTAAVLAVYAADARILPPDSPILEGNAGHPVIAGLITAGARDFVLTPTITYGAGDLAYQVGTATFAMGGVSDTVKYTEVLRRGADGRWRYVVDMFSGVSAPTAPPAGH